MSTTKGANMAREIERMAQIPLMDPAEAPATWAEWNAAGLWPDWVPEEWRKHIEGFWSERYRRGPRAWLRDAVIQEAYPHGKLLCSTKTCGDQAPIQGRFLHTWNNMSVLVDNDGTANVTSHCEIYWATERGEKPVERPSGLRAVCLKLCERARTALDNRIVRLKGQGGQA